MSKRKRVHGSRSKRFKLTKTEERDWVNIGSIHGKKVVVHRKGKGVEIGFLVPKTHHKPHRFTLKEDELAYQIAASESMAHPSYGWKKDLSIGYATVNKRKRR